MLDGSQLTLGGDIRKIVGAVADEMVHGFSALAHTGPSDFENEVVPAVFAHGGDLVKGSASHRVGLLVTLGLDDNKIMIWTSIGELAGRVPQVSAFPFMESISEMA